MLDLDQITATRALIDGKPVWCYSDGTILPVVSGGDGSDDDENDDDDEDDDSGDSDSELKKAKADAKKWRELSRQHEAKAKKNLGAVKELEKLKNENRSEDERVIAEAEARGKKAARAEFAQDLAAARIEGALAGIVDDPSEIVEDLNLSKYVNDDGEVDVDAIGKLKDRYTALAGKKPKGDAENDDDEDNDDVSDTDKGKTGGKPKNPAGNGARAGGGGNGPKQLSRDDLKTMTPEAIEQARLDGQLNDLMGVKT